MPDILTQTEFDAAAAAWMAFIGRASADAVQALFQTGHGPERQYQTYVRFDLAETVPLLLSTVGIVRVAARFVLVDAASEVVPAEPRFRVVLYATDQLGGRISAYYLGRSDYHPIPPKPKASLTAPAAQDAAADLTQDQDQGRVPFSLITNWLTAWVTAATQQQQHLSPAMFATSSYGPLQGYVFELDDFMDQLFLAPGYSQTRLYLNFGLKTYFPAYPEKPKEPTQTFGLVVRLFTPTKPPKNLNSTADATALERSDVAMISMERPSAASGTESGPSYDMATPVPPG